MATQIKPLKKFSQNFLQNKYYAEKIVDSLICRENDIILEIGAGKGVLTELLIQKKYKKLSVVEIDQRLAKLLEEKFSTDLTVIQDSILNVSFEQLAEDDRIKIIGNIPYNITSDIIFKIIDNYKYIKGAVLMVQKEVANRLVAETKTKDYGILTIFVSFHSKVQRLFNVDRENFYPVPNVDSSVVYLDFDILQNKTFDYRLFKKIVRTGFNSRRKMLRNSLKKLLILNEIDEISSILLDRRPEELSIEDFKILTNEISNKMV
ncbi:MAG: ribosomal RNA small subunit methyltransferase A [Calditrichia bacterium]|nr:ribosomal RNA small subunit methyltransferase A [Calditrichia bacterium]